MHNFILQEIHERLFERLSYIKLQPRQILYIDNATSVKSDLTRIFPNAMLTPLPYDFTIDAFFTLQPRSYDFLYFNAWFLPANFSEILMACRHLLTEHGVMLFSTLGPASLDSLANNTCIDMHNIGDKLLELQFLDPVVDNEVMRIAYDTSQDLLADFDTNCLAKYFPEYTEIDFNNQEVIFEIIYGIAYSQKITSYSDNAGNTYIPIDAIEIL